MNESLARRADWPWLLYVCSTTLPLVLAGAAALPFRAASK